MPAAFPQLSLSEAVSGSGPRQVESTQPEATVPNGAGLGGGPDRHGEGMVQSDRAAGLAGGASGQGGKRRRKVRVVATEIP